MKTIKKQLLAGVLAGVAAVAGINSTPVAAQQAERTFSIAVHIEYPDGFVYDGVFARGVPASEKSEYLAACGQSHRWGSAVQFHCYPIAE